MLLGTQATGSATGTSASVNTQAISATDPNSGALECARRLPGWTAHLQAARCSARPRVQGMHLSQATFVLSTGMAINTGLSTGTATEGSVDTKVTVDGEAGSSFGAGETSGSAAGAGKASSTSAMTSLVTPDAAVVGGFSNAQVGGRMFTPCPCHYIALPSM